MIENEAMKPNGCRLILLFRKRGTPELGSSVPEMLGEYESGLGFRV